MPESDDFERLALELLRSVDARLKAIEETVICVGFRLFHQVIAAERAAECGVHS